MWWSLGRCGGVTQWALAPSGCRNRGMGGRVQWACIGVLRPWMEGGRTLGVEPVGGACALKCYCTRRRVTVTLVEPVASPSPSPSSSRPFPSRRHCPRRRVPVAHLCTVPPPIGHVQAPMPTSIGRNTPTNSHMDANDELEADTNNLGCQGRGQPNKNKNCIHRDAVQTPRRTAELTLLSSLM